MDAASASTPSIAHGIGMPSDPATGFVERAARILAALYDGPQPQAALAACAGYRPTDAESKARMLRRDLAHLRALGFQIERQNTRPPAYRFNGWRAPAGRPPAAHTTQTQGESDATK